MMMITMMITMMMRMMRMRMMRRRRRRKSLSCCTHGLALTAVLMLLSGGARGVRVWKEGPKVGPDAKQYKTAGLRSEAWGQQLAVSVHCTENSMVVRARADLYGTGRLVTASELRLGPDISDGKCGAAQREDTELVIIAGLHECGAQLRVEDDSLVYANTLFHTPTLNRFGIVRSAGVAVPLECRYKRTHFVSSNSQSNSVVPRLSPAPPTPVFPPQSETDDWISERSMDMFLSDDVTSMVASVLSAHHSALKLFLDRCVVTLGPDSVATPSCDLIDYHGCPGDFLPGADSHVLRVKLDLLHSLGEKRRPDMSIFVTCWMKTADLVQEKSSVNKACSYMGNSWRSVDGKHKVCECCDGKCDVFRQRQMST